MEVEWTQTFNQEYYYYSKASLKEPKPPIPPKSTDLKQKSRSHDVVQDDKMKPFKPCLTTKNESIPALLPKPVNMLVLLGQNYDN